MPLSVDTRKIKEIDLPNLDTPSLTHQFSVAVGLP